MLPGLCAVFELVAFFFYFCGLQLGVHSFPVVSVCGDFGIVYGGCMLLLCGGTSALCTELACCCFMSGNWSCVRLYPVDVLTLDLVFEYRCRIILPSQHIFPLLFAINCMGDLSG